MKKLGTILGILVLFTGLASATTMQLIRFDGPSAGGANTSGGVYTYPYYFSIDGSTYPGLTALLCDSYDNEVWQGESWTVDEVTLASLIPGPNGLKYEEAAWLFSKMGTHPSNADAAKYNWAIWGLFSSTALGQGGYAASGAASVLPTASDLAGFNYSGFTVYTPTNPSNAMLNGSPVNYIPQEYIGYVPPKNGGGPPPPTPEPASFALIGAGLFAMATRFRRTR